MIRIPLTLGKFALIDDEDYALISQHTWHLVTGAQGHAYARTTIRDASGVQHKVRMHRLIMNPPPDLLVDHINGDGLDNRRSNLRLATASQNNMNTRYKKLKGIRFRPAPRKWEARIARDGQVIQIGQFRTEIAAALAYDRKARELFGEFACPNFPADFEGAYADRIYDTL